MVGTATPGDALFKSVNARLTSLDKERDGLAIKIKDELYAAENWGALVPGAQGQTASARPSSARQGSWRSLSSRSLGRTHGGAGAEWASDFCASPS